MIDLNSHIRTIKDFPVPGILFYDITTLIRKGDVFNETINRLAELAEPFKPFGAIVAPESRGFIFAAPLATRLNVGLIPIRKPGKLPCKTVSKSYGLEYGTNTVQMDIDALKNGDRVLIVDDLLATGGTVEACRSLVEENGGQVAAAAFVIELLSLKGREKIKTKNIVSLLQYEY
ncbi:MAG: adenine phosphoribosyltransferase [Planctomycetaceae bacterium]|jgi:adenine phosphoribosyltransferase|nr:adenine phosphoribosyltransferase [Planctomycetaceae bacterium]